MNSEAERNLTPEEIHLMVDVIGAAQAYDALRVSLHGLRADGRIMEPWDELLTFEQDVWVKAFQATRNGEPTPNLYRVYHLMVTEKGFFNQLHELMRDMFFAPKRKQHDPDQQ